MSTIYLKVVNSNGVLQQSKTFTPNVSGQSVIRATSPSGSGGLQFTPSMSSQPVIRATSSGGSGIIQQSLTPSVSGQPVIKVISSNGSLVVYPINALTLQSQNISVSDLSQYSNTAQMLANDATTYANAIAFVQNNYINSSSLTVSSLADVIATMPLANNSTLVYNSANNKYVVKELGVDGGTF